MGRIRTIKPELSTDEKMKQASDEARVAAVALILLSDDYGNGEAGDLVIAGAVWSSREPLEALAKASRAIRELVDMGFVQIYKVSGQPYFHITNWARHQRVDKPGKPLFPGPERADIAIAEDSRKPRETPAPDHDHDPDLRPTTPTYDQDLSSRDFESVYKRYPRREGKAKGLQLAKSQIRSQPAFEQFSAAVDEMASLWAGITKADEQYQFCPMFSSWMSQKRWQDESQAGPSKPKQDIRTGNYRHTGDEDYGEGEIKL